MGTVHKLKPEIKAFILDNKKAVPAISCRKLSEVIEEKFKIKISKSAVNFILKEANLSMPVGRRLKRQRRPVLKIQIPLLENLAPKEETIPQKELETPKEATKIEPIIILLEAPIEILNEIPQEKKPEILIENIEVKLAEVQPEAAQPITSQDVEIKQVTSIDTQPTGSILLKAADILLGGVNRISQIISKKLNSTDPEIFFKTEKLLYSFLQEDAQKEMLNNSGIMSYFNELQQVADLPSDLSKIIPELFYDVRGIKVTLRDGSIFYLDGQLHTVWSTSNIPYSFSATTYSADTYISGYSKENEPFVLMMALGYDILTSEFFDFMYGFDQSGAKSISDFSLYNNQAKELINMKPGRIGKKYFIFGLWPWQFAQYRKVNKIKEFHPFYFDQLKKEFFIAEIELELSQPNGSKGITLRGCAVKTNLNEKIRLVILSNYPEEDIDLKKLCYSYFTRWPNLEEAFQDYSRKVESFSYASNLDHKFSAECLALVSKPAAGISDIFNIYLGGLDLFVKWNFLPTGYQDIDLSTIKERFYKLEASLAVGSDHYLVTFNPPKNYAFLDDLKYACRRLNERSIFAPDKKKYWFEC